MSFKYNSYLGKEIIEESKKIQRNNQAIFDLASELNRLANTMKYDMNSTERELKKILLVGLFAKITNSFCSVVILYRYGLESDAKALSRVLYEGSMKAVAINNSEEYKNNYMELDEMEKDKTRRMIIKNTQYFNENTVKIMQQINTLGNENENKKIKKYSVHETAEIANMLDVYLNAYTKLCSTVHSDVRQLNELAEYDENTSILNIKCNPQTQDIKLILGTNIEVLRRVLLVINEVFELNYKNDIDAYKNSLVEIFKADI